MNILKKDMIPIEYELEQLKEIIFEMLELVKVQMQEVKKALLKLEPEIAEEIIRRELRVNALEITVDRECENLLALYSPVAADLRFVISALKISESLERISDHAYRIAKYITDNCLRKDEKLFKELDIENLFNTVDSMLENVSIALENQDTSLIRKVFKQDKIINKIKKNAPEILNKSIKQNNENTLNNLFIFSVIGKLERSGDQLKNIAEEIVFYIEAEIMKHKKRNKKIRKAMQKNDTTAST